MKKLEIKQIENLNGGGDCQDWFAAGGALWALVPGVGAFIGAGVGIFGLIACPGNDPSGECTGGRGTISCGTGTPGLRGG